MALNTLLSIDPWVILLMISIITLGVILYLTFTERVLKRKIDLKQQKEENSPTKRIKFLISSHDDSRNKLKKINSIAREIFRDVYNVDSRTSYYELAEKFETEKKQSATKFCQEMFRILYSGETIQSEKIAHLAKILEKINQEAQEEKSFKKLERDMKSSLKITKQGDSLFKKIFKAEDKLVDKFAKEKQIPQQQEQNTRIETNQQTQPTISPIAQQTQIEYKTKRQKLQNLPLIKLFRFRQPQGITLTSEIEQDKIENQSNSNWASIKLKVPIFSKKKQEKQIPEKKTQEKSIYQKIDDLQREVIERQKQIERMRTQQQIQELQRTAVEVEINKKEQWPPIKFTPMHLNEPKKMSPEMEKSFEKANNEIILLKNEIKNKQKDIKKLKSRPIPMRIKPQIEKPKTIMTTLFGKSDRDIEIEIQKKKQQIEIVNLKKEQHNYPTYNAPKVITPKKQIIEATPKNNPIKKEEFIHHVDNMDRIREKIRERRMEL